MEIIFFWLGQELVFKGTIQLRYKCTIIFYHVDCSINGIFVLCVLLKYFFDKAIITFIYHNGAAGLFSGSEDVFHPLKSFSHRVKLSF